MDMLWINLQDTAIGMVAILLQILLAGSLLIGAGFVLCRLLKRRSAATRHGILFAVLLLSLLAAVAGQFLPDLDMPILPLPPGLDVEEGAASLRVMSPHLAVERELVSTLGLIAAEQPASRSLGSASWNPVAIGALGLASVWLAGVVFLWFRIIVGQLFVSSIIRKGKKFSRRELDAVIGSAVGRARNFRVMYVDGIGSPFSTGILQRTVALPKSARSWPRERMRSVLLHELSHVYHHDVLTDVVLQLAVSIMWWNPLAWWALAKARVEMERRCDEEVLNAGVRPSEYASALFEVVRETRDHYLPSTALGSVHRLRDRVASILSPARGQRSIAPAAAWSFVLIGLICAVLLGAMHPWKADSVEQSAYNKAAAVFQAGTYAEAADALKRYVHKYPEEGAAWRWLGCAYRRLGNQELAIAAYQRSIENGYCDRYAEFLIACSYARLEAEKEALKHLKVSFKRGITYEEYTDYRHNFARLAQSADLARIVETQRMN